MSQGTVVVERYKNLSGDSGVLWYQVETEAIVVTFMGRPDRYRYSYESAGRENVEKMKGLAIAGRGLATFISKEKPAPIR